MIETINEQDVILCEYCKTYNYIRKELRCISCSAPLDVKLKVKPEITIRGGKGNQRLIHFGCRPPVDKDKIWIESTE